MIFRLDFMHCVGVSACHVLIYSIALFVSGMRFSRAHKPHMVLLARLVCQLIAVTISLIGAHHIDRFQRQQFLFCHYYGQTVRLLGGQEGGSSFGPGSREDWAPAGSSGFSVQTTSRGEGAWELPDLG